MRSYFLSIAGLTFGLLILAPLVRGDNQPGAKVPISKPITKEVDPKAPPAVDLPITRIVLFNAGIGYFHREGDVTGEGRLDLRFDEGDINDLLKSLVLTDKDGGKVRAVTYDNRMPIDVTLKGFAVDVTENPTVGQLMHQVRGEKIEVTDKSGVVSIGSIVSVERQPIPATGVDPGELVNMLTDDGLQTVELKQLKKIKFVRPELQAEFKKALELLASSRGDNKKTVSVVFSGNGKRKVAVGYVTEAPLWKPSYRLSVDEKGATRIQGWATVENTTDEDWTNVKVGLVAGRPMTFQMDLYDPLFVPRPMVEPDLFASLRPPMYQGGLNPVANGMPPGVGMMGAFGNGAAAIGNLGNQGFGGGGLQIGGGPFGNGAAQLGNQGNQGFGAGGLGIGGQYGLQGQFGIQGGYFSNGGYLPRVPRPDVRDMYGSRLSYEEYLSRIRGTPPTQPASADHAKPVTDPLDRKAGALAVADGTLGDIFEYKIEEPITLPRQKSAMLPLMNEAVDGSRVSIYNASTLVKYPLLGLRLVNKTKMHLAAGPVAVYDGGTFAGDARLPDVKPGETRLVSYAIDLGTEVVARPGSVKATLLSVTSSESWVTLRSNLRRTTTYLIRNRNPQDRTVIIEHPQSAEWKLVVPAKPDDQTRSYYRFDVPVKSGALTELEITEESTGTTNYGIAAAHEGLLDSEVVVRRESAKPTLLAVGVADNKVTLRSNLKRTTTYLIRNRGTADRTITVEHQESAPWKLVAPAKADEQTKGIYHFEVPVKPGAIGTLEVTEESTATETSALGSASRETLLFYVNAKEVKPAVREVFKKLLDMREKVDDAQKSIVEQQVALKEIAEDQDRIRKNIEKAPKESDAYKRYLKKFDDQETEIEKRQAKMKELKVELAKQEKALKEFADNAKAE